MIIRDGTPTMTYKPNLEYLSNFSPRDGTVEFFNRIRSILKPTDVVIDLGAGRAKWFEDDPNSFKTKLRHFTPDVKGFIGADIDSIVMKNRSTNQNLLIENGKIPLDDHSVDVVVCDYVFEHIGEPKEFSSEVDRILKPGGYLCARTPHKYNYVSIGARLIPISVQAGVLRNVQPNRKQIDIFPTHFQMNTDQQINACFPSYKSYSYVFKTEPSYFLGRKIVFKLVAAVHYIMPAWFGGNLMIFLRKPL